MDQKKLFDLREFELYDFELRGVYRIANVRYTKLVLPIYSWDWQQLRYCDVVKTLVTSRTA